MTGLTVGPHYESFRKDLAAAMDDRSNQTPQIPFNKEEMRKVKASYIYNSETKAWRITKIVLSIIIFPIGLYKLTHFMIGKVLITASRPSSMGKEYTEDYAFSCLQQLQPGWKYVFFKVKVDGTDISTFIVIPPGPLEKGRYLASFNGVGQFAEDRCFRDKLPLEEGVNHSQEQLKPTYRESTSHEFRNILTDLQSPGITPNYPGVSCSQSHPNAPKMINTAKAIMSIVQNKTIGLEATQSVFWGHSIGGGILGKALETYPLEKDCRSVILKSRTFANLSSATSHLINYEARERLGKVFGAIVGEIVAFIAKCCIRFFGWNLDAVASSQKINAPQITLQTANMTDEHPHYVELRDASNIPQIKSEEAIRAGASYAKALLNGKTPPDDKQTILGISAMHCDPIADLHVLTDLIKEKLTH